MLRGFFDFLFDMFKPPKPERKPPAAEPLPPPVTPTIPRPQPKEEEPEVNYSDPALLKKKEDWFIQTIADLDRHEGFRPYAYPDPLSELGRRYPAARYKWGFRPAHQILLEIGEMPEKGRPWTVGYGFTNGVNHHTTIDKVVAQRRLEGEIITHVHILDILIPEWRNMPTYVKTVLANMAFNLGSRLKQFKPTLEVFKRGDYHAAGHRLEKSLWYKQTKARAKELVERLTTGKIQEQYKVI